MVLFNSAAGKAFSLAWFLRSFLVSFVKSSWRRCPGGVSGYPRAWYGSVSWVRAPPSAYSYKFVGTFSCAQINLRKARKRELATLDEKSTSNGIAEPYARWKNWRQERGGEKGWHLWPRHVQAVKCEWRKKKNGERSIDRARVSCQPFWLSVSCRSKSNNIPANPNPSKWMQRRTKWIRNIGDMFSFDVCACRLCS